LHTWDTQINKTGDTQIGKEKHKSREGLRACWGGWQNGHIEMHCQGICTEKQPRLEGMSVSQLDIWENAREGRPAREEV
jgi:hypothetical protein